MDVQRVAIIFDNVDRPETTGIYCRRALGQLVEVEHLLPSELEALPRGRFDLFLNIDDGLDYRLPSDLRPAALWAIDTHLDFERTLRKAPDFDVVFAAQRDGADALRRQGIASASWLPLACDPERHGRVEIAKQFDVCFVGNVFPGMRADLLTLIQKEFPSHFVGRRYFEEMAEIYSASRIVFNRSVRNDVNMRVFEALASGSLLATNDLTENGLAELFEDQIELATYRDAGDLLETIRFYLRHDKLRERIAEAGRAKVLAGHTYLDRMRTLLEAASRLTRRVPQAAPTGIALTPASKTKTYFECERPEVVALIPAGTRRMLDIGCGAGRLGETLKLRQDVEVVGIELVPAAAEAARRRLDQVLMVDVESDDVTFPAGRFDCVVCADVLEHLRDPRHVIAKIRRWLTPDGVLVASLPNVRNHSVVSSLLEGNWTYEPAGLLDDDHVRFFTRREIEKLFYREGFEIQTLKSKPGSGYEEWHQSGRPGAVRIGSMNIAGIAPQNAEEFFTYQYLVVARPHLKPERQPSELTSIIVVMHNELEYTRLCLDSLRHRTDDLYELIFVDNGSTDGTVEHFQEFCNDVETTVRSSQSCDESYGLQAAKLITNRENRGFPAAVNQGIAAAHGDCILLLNNDTVLTTGWLRRLREAMESDPTIGLVGPCTNNISGSQQVPTNYHDLACLDGFAWDWGKAHVGERIETDRLVGFCLLIRRCVIDRIGLLDERFGIGNFEDDDFCRRAKAAGFRAVIAADAFIHHFGSRTFLGSGVDLAGLLAENSRKFDEKWNDAATQQDEARNDCADIPRPTGDTAPGLVSLKNRSERPRFVLEATRKPGLLLQSNKTKLSLCMIVRDNANTIGPCLKSIRPWVDEIVVVDTGSKDKTPQLCRRFGARVFEFPWCDDFSAVRNESVRHARGEWIFWMDSDDTIPEECGRQLRTLADSHHPEQILGYVMQVHCPATSHADVRDVTIVDHVKLFRNRPDLAFEGRIHEQLLGAIRRAGGDVLWTDLHVVHSGSDRSVDGRRRKLERDLRILNTELAENPDHPFVLFNLGMTYVDVERWGDAIGYLERSLVVSKPGESHVRKVYALLASSLSRVNRQDDAWKCCQQGRALYPDDKELLFRSAMLHHHFGRLAEAERNYLAILEGSEERHFSSVDQGLMGYKARHNLAIVYHEMNDYEKAAHQWRAITIEQPGYVAAWRGLADTLIKSAKCDEAQKIADDLAARGGAMRSEALFLRGMIAENRGDLELAASAFEAADRHDPHDQEPLRSLCKTLFDKGDLELTEQKLLELTRREPKDAAAYRNLGTVRFRRRDFTAAAAALARAVELRPDSPDTWMQWGTSLSLSGHTDEAVSVWKRLLSHYPGHQEAMAALEALEHPQPAEVVTS